MNITIDNGADIARRIDTADMSRRLGQNVTEYEHLKRERQWANENNLTMLIL